MKNFLLTAIFALVGFTSLYAQTGNDEKYMMGDAVSSQEDLTSGKYFIRAHVVNDNSKAGLIQGSDNKYYSVIIADIYDLASGYTDNYDQVWEIEVSDDTSEGKIFNVKNIGFEKYLSKKGKSGLAKGNLIWSSDNPDEVAMFRLEEVPGEYDGNKRFFMQLTTGSDDATYVHSNGSYLKFDEGSAETGSTVQFDFIKAEPAVEVNIQVMFPTFNGTDLGWRTITALQGKDPSKMISYYANDEMGMGGFTLTGLIDEEGNQVETVSGAGQKIYAKGIWDRELKTEQVFRIRFNPSDNNYGALRYMLSNYTIETQRGNEETLTSLVPERLWYFTKVDGGYLLHTLYDPTQAVRFIKEEGSSWTDAVAKLANTDDATVLELVYYQDGDYLIKIAGTENAWVGDFYSGYLTVDEDGYSDETSQMRLYPLTDDDFAVLANIANQEDVDAAKADPSIENIKKVVDAYNALNLEAAKKRLEYFEGTRIIGLNPGQFSDPAGKLADAKKDLNAVIEKGDNATDEDKETVINEINNLVDNMEPSQLTRNGVKEGVFYRFKTKLEAPKFISALSGGETGGKEAMALTADNTRSHTVFYVERGEKEGTFTVICFENGLVMPNMNGESLMPALHGTPDASTGVSFKDMNDGCFLITVDAAGARNLRRNNNGDLVVAGSNTSSDSRWYIERVTELPLTFYNVMGMDEYDDGWSSVYSPVALEIPKEYERTTAYTGILDFKDYNTSTNINHVLATPISKDEVTGTIIIPANQPTLLYYNGKITAGDNPYVNESLLDSRQHISYINVPILYDDDTPVSDASKTGEEDMKALSGSYFATPKTDGTDYYTLHASHYNNFREYSEFETGYSYVPGFKAYIEKAHDDLTAYPICQINPNAMAPSDNRDEPLPANYVFEETSSDDGTRHVTITLDKIYTTSGEDVTYNCKLYYKYTPLADTKHRLVSHDGYTKAASDGKEHSFDVQPGRIDYYVYHPDTDTKSADRTFTINSDGTTTEIKNVKAGKEGADEYYDLQGRRLFAPIKGINIVNGKKTLLR